MSFSLRKSQTSCLFDPIFRYQRPPHSYIHTKDIVKGTEIVCETSSENWNTTLRKNHIHDDVRKLRDNADGFLAVLAVIFLFVVDATPLQL